jgi:predicted transcriptional regulator of viral defense system
MASFAGDIDDIKVEDRLYALGESQGGYLTARQAIDAGVARSTLTYHAREDRMLQRVGRGVYRMRRFPSSPHEHVIPFGWVSLARRLWSRMSARWS